jgi:hypothetical protein
MAEFNEWGIGGIIRMNLTAPGAKFSHAAFVIRWAWISPKDGILWFADNQVDGMGDDIPPEELNRAPQAGLNFGFPWSGGGTPAPMNTRMRRRRKASCFPRSKPPRMSPISV